MATHYRIEDIPGLMEQCELGLRDAFARVDAIALANQRKVLTAMQRARLADYHFKGSTGYGYGDAGRAALDAVYAEVFEAEAALVRQHFVSGTHALGSVLYGILRPGDQLISVCGAPYDTLQSLIGYGAAPVSGSLKEYGVAYKEIALTETGAVDVPAVLDAIQPHTKMLLVQRSRGYAWREALRIPDIQAFCQEVKAQHPGLIIFVDNCYGEFTSTQEPTAVGADIVAGSLIKNPGGGIAPGGGYVAGREHLVAMAADRLTMPGLGSKMGATSSEQLRLFFQGLFLAPHVTAQSLKGMHLCAAVLEKLGYRVSPAPETARGDIIQAVRLDSAEQIIRMAQAIQAASPVDSAAVPEPGDMPGYADPIIMAAGAFVQGSSIELSLDAPLRPPYTVYVQGGLTYEHVKLALFDVCSALLEEGIDAAPLPNL